MHHKPRNPTRIATSILALALLIAPGIARAENEGGTGRVASIAGSIADWLLDLGGLTSPFTDADPQTAEPTAGNGTGGQVFAGDPEASGGSGGPTREDDGQGTGHGGAGGGGTGKLR